MATNSNPPSTPSKLSKTTTVSKVRVVVRVRPFLDREISLSNPNPVPCVSLLAHHFNYSDEVTVHLKDQETSRNEGYKLDGYFGQEDNNVEKVFENEVKGLIPGIFRGCNASVFAYGATGGGKTYTMQGTDQQPGLMSLTMSTVLPMCQATGSIAQISYYEVYLDRCYDLLELKAKEISALDDRDGQMHLRGLSRVPVKSMSEFHEVFTRGSQRRTVAHTGLNDVSSRSHAVLVISVSPTSDNELEGSITGKLNLIDLAGNEDNKRTANEGIRLQESAKISQSLFALSNVIYAINNSKPWVPYRESKLTRILQDSLGGTSRALMIACLNPGNYKEAVHTVSLAARSRHISNAVPSAQKQETPKIKIDMEAKLQAWLESKGKSKSAHRKIAFGSPSLLRTPGHGSSMKKQVLQHSSIKDMAGNQGNPMVKDSSFVPPRNLFDHAASDIGNKGLKCINDCSTINMFLTAHEDQSLNHSLPDPESVLSYDCFSKVKEPVLRDIDEECILDGTKLESTVCLSDDLLEEVKKTNNGASSSIQSPANRPKILSCQSPLRKALSPINTNIADIPLNEISSRESVLSVLLASSSTPSTPFVVREVQELKTPLGKFNECSSNLKSYLVQEYIDFLNSATREELVELKGIGVKRAEYIMNVRETSALKSLNDLEKIGLSSKQVQQMFSTAAKGIF